MLFHLTLLVSILTNESSIYTLGIWGLYGGDQVFYLRDGSTDLQLPADEDDQNISQHPKPIKSLFLVRTTVWEPLVEQIYVTGTDTYSK